MSQIDLAGDDVTDDVDDAGAELAAAVAVLRRHGIEAPLLAEAEKPCALSTIGCVKAADALEDAGHHTAAWRIRFAPGNPRYELARRLAAEHLHVNNIRRL